MFPQVAGRVRVIDDNSTRGTIVATAQGAPTMSGAFATVALNTGAIIGPVAGGVALAAVGSSGPAWASAVLVLLAGGVFSVASR
ncbi:MULTISPECIES: hypothetical protein [unclassified Rhodococcus (in: high G+C Gram-positive bacteria)]|uniref:hypothetical protein n=1 Tax=unclassified Rhodococcus (in: high G+C Gram-positive bacteria) TaxID=192944 RepID=UPI003393E5B9